MLIFAPDAQDIAPEILTAISGMPTMRGYKSPPTASSTICNALEAAPIGGSVVIDVNGAKKIYAGTSSKLFSQSAAAWTNVSRVGNYTLLGNPAAGHRWRFAAFGTDVFASTGPKNLWTTINTAIALQKSTAGAAFTDVNGPAATCIAAVENFLFLGNTNDVVMSPGPGFGGQGNRWWCSGLNNGSTWVPDVVTQCTSGLLVATPGEITAIANLSGRCVIYKNGSIYVGDYVGPPEAWRFNVVATDVGAYTQECIANVGDKHYFIGAKDIYEFDGSRPVPIGAGVREWFFARVTKEGLSKVQSLHDQTLQNIYWFYPSSTGGGGLDSVLVYNYGTKRFGAFDYTVSEVLETIGGSADSADGGTTVEQLNRLYLDGSYVTKSLTGAGTTLTMTTGWLGDEFKYSALTRVKPKFRTAPSAGTCTPSHCTHVNATPTTGSAVNISSGRFDILQSARYHRFALSLTGDVEIEAIQPVLVPVGLE